jgi:hypothetical protein
MAVEHMDSTAVAVEAVKELKVMVPKEPLLEEELPVVEAVQYLLQVLLAVSHSNTLDHSEG